MATLEELQERQDVNTDSVIPADSTTSSSKSDDEEFAKIQKRKKQWFNTHSIRWRITFVLFSGIGLFGLLLTVLLALSNKQAVMLEQLQEQRYPIKSQAELALYTLKDVQSALLDALMVPNGSLDEAVTLESDFRKTLMSISIIDPAKKSSIDEINTAFSDYFNHSLHMISSSPSDFVDLGIEKNLQLNSQLFSDVLRQVENFIETEFIEFTKEVSEVSAQANAVVGFGVPLAIVLTLFFALLTFLTIKSTLNRIDVMGRTLKGIAEYNGDMSVRIQLSGTDEMSELGYWFNRFMARLQKVTLAATAEVRQLAFTDSLTELPNRRAFHERLKMELSRNKESGGILAVMFIDLDNFKSINDQLGHEAGDELVKIIAHRLIKALRPDDALANNLEPTASSIARLGGDEFMIICPRLSDRRDAEIIARRIFSDVLSSIDLRGNRVEVGASIGISISPDDSILADELIVKADMAMYQMKKKGKNNYCFFNDELEKLAKYNGFIESALWALIKQQEHSGFSFSYQPKYDVDTGVVVGAEALMRWTSEEYGPVPPSDFIVVAENSHLILELDAWVISNVCQQIRKWHDMGVTDLPIAINISANMASSKMLVDLVLGTLKVNSVSPSDIEIEITETSALLDIKSVARNIRDLRSAGIQVSIDDFGAGHASLLLLKYCEIDALKIDRSFVSEVELKENSILSGIIALAHSLNIKTIAEGVETQEHLTMLKQMNCSVAQGYFLNRPLTVDAFETYLKASKVV